MVKKILIGFYAVAVLLGALVVNYVAPVHVVGKVTGSEVKRVDNDGPVSAKNKANGPTRDVYYIYIERPDSEVLVLRNEDTRWGLPPYFKFGSATLQAKAKSFETSEVWVELAYYGWRVEMLSVFPNILSIKSTDSKEPSANIARGILLAFYFSLIGYATFKSVRFIRRKRKG